MLSEPSRRFLRDASAAAAGVFVADVVRQLAKDPTTRRAIKKIVDMVRGALGDKEVERADGE